jgi:23S rRNA pseudouridine1911/1915/1917 synthase
VDVEGTPARASRLLARGERVTVRFPDTEPPRTLLPANIPLTVVFEDEHLAVIDKPAGLVVHPAPGHWDDTLVNALVARGTTLSGGAEGRPGIVHRLDRDTSGLMVVAKTDLAHRRLGAAIAARRISRPIMTP